MLSNKNDIGLLSNFLKKIRYAVAKREIANNRPFVLDVGCGEGGLKNIISEKIKYFGLDVRPNMDENIFACDVTKGFPERVNSMRSDYVVALAFIEHIIDVSFFLNNCRKVLKPGGIIIITTPHPISRRIHEIGASMGLFSKEAAEVHGKIIDKKAIEIFCSEVGPKIVKYRRFLFGFNRLFVLEGV